MLAHEVRGTVLASLAARFEELLERGGGGDIELSRGSLSPPRRTAATKAKTAQCIVDRRFGARGRHLKIRIRPLSREEPEVNFEGKLKF